MINSTIRNVGLRWKASKHSFSLGFTWRRSVSSAMREAKLDEHLQDQPVSLESKSLKTSQLQFIEPANEPIVPTFSLLNRDGSLVEGEQTRKLLEENELSPEKIIELYKGMIRLNAMDKVLFDSQRQGRISFYMTSFGEEATQFGSAGALSDRDWVFAQYRESGLLLHRQMSLKLMLAQCYGNKEDLGKGRQMPIHYGNRQLNYVTISSTLATQMPQAAGTAYAFKQDNKTHADWHNRRMVACYFGEGAASEGDAHAAMNFAATLDCPVMFFCRNNAYAISTPTSEQYRGDGVVTRAIGYGMQAIRVDGNDLFAVYLATREARRRCLLESKPILVEAMTYRVGHHSTSDDSSAYRPSDELHQWESEGAAPIERVYRYLVNENLWTENEDKIIKSNARAQVIEALNYAEKVKRLPVTTMFDDVYDQMPDNLREQSKELREHLEKYGQHYPINEHEGI